MPTSCLMAEPYWYQNKAQNSDKVYVVVILTLRLSGLSDEFAVVGLWGKRGARLAHQVKFRSRSRGLAEDEAEILARGLRRKLYDALSDYQHEQIQATERAALDAACDELGWGRLENVRGSSAPSPKAKAEPVKPPSAWRRKSKPAAKKVVAEDVPAPQPVLGPGPAPFISRRRREL